MSSNKSSITPKRRISENLDANLIEKKIDGENVIWCKLCQVKVCHKKKSSVLQHLATVIHKKLSQGKGSSKKLSFDEDNLEPNERNKMRSQFASDLLMAFASADIPVQKLENRVFRSLMSKYIKEEYVNCWPSTSTVRNKLASVYDKEVNKLKDCFADKKVAIIADETTDEEQRAEKYFFEGGQPSMNLFKFIRFLDPHFFKLQHVDPSEVSKEIKEVNSCLDEFALYNECCTNLRDTVDIKEFWKINRINLPKLYELAKHFLNFPVSTASVERSFSKYNSILSDFRKRVLPSNLIALNFLYFNKNQHSELIEVVEETEEELIIVMEVE